MELAEEWIKDHSGKISISRDEDPNRLLHLNHCSFPGVRYNFFYQQISRILTEIGFDDLPILLKDLVVIRIFEPDSTLRSLELFE